MNLRESLVRLPKAELHCHLDGSLRPQTVLDLAKEQRISLGVNSIDELKEALVCGRPVKSLPEFLRAFDITCSVLQSKEALERVAYELVEDFSREGGRYIEVRYAPLLSGERGLSERDVILAIRRGLDRAQKAFGTRAQIIVCALRNLDPNVSKRTARVAAEMAGEAVAGFDLAQAERGNPAGKHREAFDLARNAGLGITVHAGEDDAPSSIQDALESLGAQRIGHGRTLPENPTLEAAVAKSGVAVECCPSSNVQIQLTPRFEDHPLKGMFERGVRVTLNTDNRLLTGISLTDEYERAHEKLGLTFSQLREIALNGFRAAFLPPAEKEALLQSVASELSMPAG